MKRVFSFMLCVVLVLLLAVPAYASTNGPTPRYKHIDTIYANLTINRTWGIATCEGMTAASGDYRAEVDVTLQVYKDGYWQTLKTWTKSDLGITAASGRYAIPRGYTYRTYTAAFIFDGNGKIIDSGFATYAVEYY